MGRRARSFDALAVIERGYDLDADTETWVARVRDAVSTGFHPEARVGATLWDIRGDTPRVEASAQDPRETAENERALVRLVARMPRAMLDGFFGASPFIGRAQSDPDILAIMRAERVHTMESIGFAVGDGAGRGLAVGSFVPSGTHLRAGDTRRWFRVSAHLGAALRLRHRLTGGPREPDAVITPTGRLAHLSGDTRRRSVRDALVDAVRRLERARALRRTEPDEALALFRALVAGRYSVVDWVDADGKRFAIVHENPFPQRSPLALSRREGDVAERLLEGRSNSEIAYLLGLSTGTVNRIARDVLSKLGRARRGDLPRTFEHGMRVGELTTEGESPRALAVVGTPGPEARWASLTPAERDVAARAIAGESNAAIAAGRGVSVRTIANQLAGVYARFGVRGRVELGGLLGEPPADPP